MNRGELVVGGEYMVIAGHGSYRDVFRVVLIGEERKRSGDRMRTNLCFAVTRATSEITPETEWQPRSFDGREIRMPWALYAQDQAEKEATERKQQELREAAARRLRAVPGLDDRVGFEIDRSRWDGQADYPDDVGDTIVWLPLSTLEELAARAAGKAS